MIYIVLYIACDVYMIWCPFYNVSFYGSFSLLCVFGPLWCIVREILDHIVFLRIVVLSTRLITETKYFMFH